MDVDEAELPEMRRATRWAAEVTDRNTGRRYLVRDFPCGLGCRCDAVIVRELTVRH
jgi:hypothetical protein